MKTFIKCSVTISIMVNNKGHLQTFDHYNQSRSCDVISALRTVRTAGNLTYSEMQ